MLSERTMELIAAVNDKKSAGKKLTMDDKLLVKMSDGKWHDAAELAYSVSWRFGGYLHILKKKGVDWEKERIPDADGHAFRYRLCEQDDGE